MASDLVRKAHMTARNRSIQLDQNRKRLCLEGRYQESEKNPQNGTHCLQIRRTSEELLRANDKMTNNPVHKQAEDRQERRTGGSPYVLSPEGEANQTTRCCWSPTRYQGDWSKKNKTKPETSICTKCAQEVKPYGWKIGCQGLGEGKQGLTSLRGARCYLGGEKMFWGQMRVRLAVGVAESLPFHGYSMYCESHLK